MSNSKIQIKVGIVEFSGEGDQDWLALQLDKIIAKVPELLKIELATPGKETNDAIGDKLDASKTNSSFKTSNLATWLKDKGATTNQVKKFLATAAYIQIGGKDRLATGDIVAALKKSNQSKLGNPSDCLNGNVKKGLCEKDGNEFFVTVEGIESLGIK
ncbi:hypothetical protein [Mucilaginibacter sp.]|uniref:hypothetical protein n=1 Tax=Mucilaginibacter sp. TaxID=1882438 RepID=UPI0026386851|nr:hypothetical protein [Mucilaginibacter sp.]MDB4919501.1 hypothetical protein [Mucilaginibacter sp.]